MLKLMEENHFHKSSGDRFIESHPTAKFIIECCNLRTQFFCGYITVLLEYINGSLLFSAFDGAHGDEPWVISNIGTGNFDINEQPLFSMYPNPAGEKVAIEFLKDYLGAMNMYDNQGRMVRSEYLKNKKQLQMDLTGYENGIYLL